MEENIQETLSFYLLPHQHPKRMKSTNMLERLNDEIKRRTLLIGIFSNPASCLRLIRALAVEMHKNWIEATRYLKIEPLVDQKKEALGKVAQLSRNTARDWYTELGEYCLTKSDKRIFFINPIKFRHGRIKE